jgi:hypothetical protein
MNLASALCGIFLFSFLTFACVFAMPHNPDDMTGVVGVLLVVIGPVSLYMADPFEEHAPPIAA